ncbi:hypothetical protein QWY75_06370 [Pontixanthobacter aestiaquae]|uniref:DUF4398 domain-containing protein n=1 Tax=Pontixanthobacter aestiaquae TaxID=1509367 RepID=A0A844Z8M2_9SPHN|nr:hypothetical protein [Pontixanthobacter aestiaquae]MDN3645825.1 hypothetical protein [Pontixanthobacter aestiaquae]MXO83180.1 hypothetical protein [Pontixanthobacter aestiaquae]
MPFVLVVVSGLILGGCASSSKTYPSLAIRDAERVSGTFSVPETIEPAPLSTQVIGQLGQIRADAAAAHQAFVAAAPGARGTVSAGTRAEVTSNAWAAAQIAMADLDSLRSVTAVALADLDLLFVDATLAFEQRQKVAEARDEVIAYLREEDATLADLRARAGN